MANIISVTVEQFNNTVNDTPVTELITISDIQSVKDVNGKGQITTKKDALNAHNTYITTELSAAIKTKADANGVSITSSIPVTGAATAINASATATAANIAGGVITSTSASATSITLPTATLLAAQLGAGRGTTFDFSIDNTAGASTVTVVVGTGIVAGPAVVTGGATLTVAASATQGVGLFRLYFSSATTAVLFRIG